LKQRNLTTIKDLDMQYQNGIRLASAAGAILGSAAAEAADKSKSKPKPKPKKPMPPMDPTTAEYIKDYGASVSRTISETPALDEAALEKAIAALATYDFGQRYEIVRPIDDAVIALHGDAAACKGLETQLAAVLATGVQRGAKDFVCRKLTVIGTAASVPALAGLLADKDLTHMARYALERIPAPEAAQALRDALAKLGGAAKVGVIGSLGSRRDLDSVATLAALLSDADPAVACAAATALGHLGSPEAAEALGNFAKQAPEGVKQAVVDANLASAEQLLADGKKADAMRIYKSLLGEDQPKHVRLAATRGMLRVAGKKD
jgi:HEAT repeat protein